MYIEILAQQSIKAQGGVRGLKILYELLQGTFFYAHKEGYPMYFTFSILFIKS